MSNDSISRRGDLNRAAVEGHRMVHQTLHGYADGHRLLTGSLVLPRPDAELMLELSDASGRGAGSAFDPYLTGYPLPESGYYVLARTWFAPEMPRPGCVWTHSLVIDPAALGSIEQPGELFVLFRRPNGPTPELDGYGVPLSMTTGWDSGEHLSLLPRELRATLLQWCYSHWPGPAFIEAPAANPMEALLVAVWLQQWPALRRRASFCSGSLSLRRVHDQPFWLQSGPRSAIRRIANNEHVWIYGEVSHEIWKWALVAAGDLPSNGMTPLRQFLRDVGDSVEDAKVLPLLTEVYALIEGAEQDRQEWYKAAAEALHLAANHPELPEAALYILLAEREDPDQDLALLAEILASDRVLDLEALRVPMRIAQVWGREPAAATRLTAQFLEREPALAEGALVLAGRFLSPATLRSLATAADRDAAALAVLRAVVLGLPTLALHSTAWPQWDSGARLLLDAILHQIRKHPDASLRARLVEVLVESKLDAAAGPVFRALGAFAVLAFLDTQRNAVLPNLETWWAQVAERASVLNDWLLAQKEPPPAALLRAASRALAKKGPSALRTIDPAPWKALASTVARSKEASEEAAFLVALARMNQEHRDSLALADSAAVVVYEQARRKRLSKQAHDLLNATLAHDGKGRDWDLCERLVKSLLKLATRHKAPPMTLRAARHPAIKESLERRLEKEADASPWARFLPWTS